MAPRFPRIALAVGLVGLILALPAYGSINKSVTIEAGESSEGASSVNGSITVGDGATVTGELHTVNGSIRVGEGATIVNAGTVNGAVRVSDNVNCEELSTVNGSIRLAKNVSVDGDVSTVNGAIDVGGGSKVANDVGNVNGGIELAGSEVGGNVTTVSGDIELAEGAVVRGDIIVREPKNQGWNFFSSDPDVIIGPGSRVEGTIRLEREVDLYISETATVGGVEGVMTIDDAVRFSGERP